MKKIFLVIIIIFSLIIVNPKEYYCDISNKGISEIEEFILEENEFVENGFKLEYITKNSIEKELDRIYEVLSKNSFVEIIKEEYSIKAIKEKIECDVNLYYYKDNLKVDIIILNKNKDISLENIKELSYKIRSEKFVSQRYFSYVKVKIYNRDIVNDMEFNKLIEEKEELEISNGRVYKAITQNKTEINIGQIDYDTGSYLIIGTPKIFITY